MKKAYPKKVKKGKTKDTRPVRPKKKPAKKTLDKRKRTRIPY